MAESSKKKQTKTKKTSSAKKPTKKKTVRRKTPSPKASRSSSTSRFDQELEHLDKAHKSGLLSAKEYREAKKVLEKKEAAHHAKLEDAAAKERAVEAIVGEPLTPSPPKKRTSRKKGSQKYFMKIEKPKGAKKEETAKSSEKEVAKEEEKKPVAVPVTKDTMQQEAVAQKPVASSVDTAVENVSKSPYTYKDIDTMVEDQDTNWRLGLAVLTVFLLILLYIKFTSFGAVGSVVLIDVYLDPASSYSYDTFAALQDVQATYGEQVLITYHFAGRSDASLLAHHAVSCAKDQEAEYAYLLYLFGQPYGSLNDAAVVSFAEALELDAEMFASCMEQDRADLHEAEVLAAEEAGVMYTPTLVINNKKVVGDVGVDAVSTIIDAELKSLG